MDQERYREMVINRVNPSVKKKGTAVAKGAILYPDSAERDLAKLFVAYERIQSAEIREAMPEIRAVFKQVRSDDANYDAFFDAAGKLRDIFDRMKRRIEKKLAEFGIEKRISKSARLARNNAVRQWEAALKRTLGIDVDTDYYDDEFFSSIIEEWSANSITKSQEARMNEIQEIESIIAEGISNKTPITDIAKRVNETHRKAKSAAKSGARDAMGNLNSELNKAIYEDAGVDRYMWRDRGDSKVRDCHRSLNGKIFSWNDPPAMWRITKAHGIVYTGQFCHPGEDYGCRCVAIPVFNISTLDVPVKQGN